MTRPAVPDAPVAVSRDVRGFLNVCCLGAYREVTWEIVHSFFESRLTTAASKSRWVYWATKLTRTL